MITKIQEKAILVSTILASSMAFIDFTALNVAFPAIQKDLGIGGSDLLWISNGYALFLSALLLVGGALGDLFGRKKIFLLGIIFFSLSSIFCGLSQTATSLIFGRCAQGIGGALMVPGSLSIISALFPPERRGWAIGTWSMFSAMTTILGPVIGGWLAGMGLWRFVFFLNVPLALVSIILLVLLVPESKKAGSTQVDILGSILITLALAGLTFGFIEAPERGFSHPVIMGSLGAGSLFLILFIYVEGRSPIAMMPISLFRNRIFSAANFLTLLLYGGLGGFLFFFPLNLIQVQGYPAEIAGFTMLPFGLLIAILSKFSGAWADKVGVRKPLILGTFLTGLGFFLFSIPNLTAGPQAYWTTFFPAILIAGTGMGLVVAPLTTAVMNAVPIENSGTASGINNSISRTASLLAISIMGALVLLSFDSEIRIYLDGLNLQPEVYQAFIAEIPKLADARPPNFCSEAQQKGIMMAIKMAFIHAFNQSAHIASVLSFGGLFIATFLLKNKA
jgi:EmrB/QacA subfamily drug resistance transporter